jgi:hypothetical protein
MNKAVINKVPLERLQELFHIFEELACEIEWSRHNGELIVRVGGEFELEMNADPKELAEIEEDDYWMQDAENIAEGLWRE